MANGNIQGLIDFDHKFNCMYQLISICCSSADAAVTPRTMEDYLEKFMVVCGRDAGMSEEQANNAIELLLDSPSYYGESWEGIKQDLSLRLCTAERRFYDWLRIRHGA